MRLLINRRPYRCSRTTSTRFPMSAFKKQVTELWVTTSQWLSYSPIMDFYSGRQYAYMYMFKHKPNIIVILKIHENIYYLQGYNVRGLISTYTFEVFKVTLVFLHCDITPLYTLIKSIANKGGGVCYSMVSNSFWRLNFSYVVIVTVVDHRSRDHL